MDPFNILATLQQKTGHIRSSNHFEKVCEEIKQNQHSVRAIS